MNISILPQNISELIGHLHPLLVHLPIGILLLAGLFQFLALKQKYSFLTPAIGITLFWGTISAIASCISGYILSGTGDYEEQLVNTHQWMGIATALISLISYLFFKWEKGFNKWVIALMVLLIIITGHLGGSLTHGSDYLLKGFKNDKQPGKEYKPIANVQEANVYTDIIQPIFENRCYTCHNKSKKKGGLRLDEPSLILKGGKDGEVIKPGDADGSEMLKRLLLPPNDDDHMPPKEKPQPKDDEIALIHWWIASGAAFDKKTNELDQPEKIKPVLLALQMVKPSNTIPDVPGSPVVPADSKTIMQLKERGVVMLPVSRNSNYLSASFVTVDTVKDSDLGLLASLKKQLVWLNLGKKKVSDEMLGKIGELDNLTRLQLDNTLLTDKGLTSLQKLSNLQYLNLYGTSVTSSGVLQLKHLPKLQVIYLYKTSVNSSDWVMLKAAFPKVTLDTGEYVVPMLDTDTVIVKPPTVKN